MKISALPAIAGLALVASLGAQSASAYVNTTKTAPYANLRTSVQSDFAALGIKANAASLSYDKLTRIEQVLKSQASTHMKAAGVMHIIKSETSFE
ncbi:MAG: hypothetical protein GC146_03435 [Limimaricola sp.]|uniref:hypothetical protein n=1 Tax=Limimaricola sp. TaxID=2211665 RepID=UPI001D5369D1|nr:hypothetical protein [Limimaricola sp.]MBI1416253.1 hypothetical protein [Limimaricola sp.]